MRSAGGCGADGAGCPGPGTGSRLAGRGTGVATVNGVRIFARSTAALRVVAGRNSPPRGRTAARDDLRDTRDTPGRMRDPWHGDWRLFTDAVRGGSLAPGVGTAPEATAAGS